MKVVILAGGLGTRISEESHLRPKPMIEIGGQPILWHIMNSYAQYGFDDFIICLGYKGHVIKEYFNHFHLHYSDLKFDFSNNNSISYLNNKTTPWKVTLIDTGLNTMTAGRLTRIKKYLNPNETFLMTYGDGLCDVNINTLVDYHKNHGLMATVTAVNPPGRFGLLTHDDEDYVLGLAEKPPGDGAYINGGFFVFEPKVLEFMGGDESILEQGPLQEIAKQRQIKCYRHSGFWQCMDTLRDKILLDNLCSKGNMPWIKK